jgi:hypothetical protein
MSAQTNSWDAKAMLPSAGNAISTGALGAASLRLHEAKPLAQVPFGQQKVRIVRSEKSLWAIVLGNGQNYLAARLCHDAGGLKKVSRDSGGGLTLTAEGAAGSYEMLLTTVEHEHPVVRCTTTFRPAQSVLLSPGDRDLFVLSRSGPAGRGMVHATQKGCEAGFAFFSVADAGCFFYLQNFSALRDYWKATCTEPKETVSAEWPELGFRLPVTNEKPLPEGKACVISDWLLARADELPEDEYAMADRFLEMMSAAYLVLRRPETTYYHWPRNAADSLRTLNSCKACGRRIKGRQYLNAYVGSSYKPPESMVQWALLVPLLEFGVWNQKPVALAEQMLKAVPSFYDAKAHSVARWLPGVPFAKKELSEEEHREVMDSWYLVHTIHNLGRLVEMGQRHFSALFFESVAYLMKAAAHFKHDWPVFYNFYTLEIIKKETEAGAGGEQDVPGLYVKVMMLAYELSREPRYLHEAEAAAARLKDLGLKLLYQTNNTVMAAVALAMLWKHTSNRLYLDTSRLCLANAASRLWIWELGVGCSEHYSTFMALPPLHNAPYASPYEEAEIFASLQKYLEVVGPELTEPLRLLIAEYGKYLLHRGRYYYPTELPAEVISDKVREGFVDRDLPMPLEDIYPVSEKAGQVGQEVYGAACPFILVTHAYVRLKEMPFLIFCEYPILQHSFREEEEEGVMILHIGGSARLRCRLSCISPDDKADWHAVRITTSDAGQTPWLELPIDETTSQMQTWKIHGSMRIAVRWKVTHAKRSPSRRRRQK